MKKQPRMSNPRSVALVRLRNAGLVDHKDAPAVTDDVVFSLML